jgi:hypothetical protein
MMEYLAEVRRMEMFFDGFEVWYVKRLDNYDIDHQSWIASSRAPTPLNIIIQKISKPLVKLPEENNEAVKQDLMVIVEPDQEPECDWMHQIKMFMEN